MKTSRTWFDKKSMGFEDLFSWGRIDRVFVKVQFVFSHSQFGEKSNLWTVLSSMTLSQVFDGIKCQRTERAFSERILTKDPEARFANGLFGVVTVRTHSVWRRHILSLLLLCRLTRTEMLNFRPHTHVCIEDTLHKARMWQKRQNWRHKLSRRIICEIS